MNKAKEFLLKNKKVVIPIAVVLVLLIVVAICFGVRSCARKDVTDLLTVAQTDNTNASAETNTATLEASQATSDNTGVNSTDPAVQTPATPDAGTTGSVANQSTGSSGTNSAQGASHQHTWKAHTAQKWVSNIVTVVDRPEKTEKYSIYRMYWYNTGKWEETRDPERFDEWYKSKNGGLYTLYNPYPKPEDDPLRTSPIHKQPHHQRTVLRCDTGGYA